VFSFLFAGLIGAAGLSGCEEENKYIKPPRPKVTVAEPIVRDVIDYLEFTGTTEASARVEVRARVPGVLKSMHFVPGTTVQSGDLLFVIDPDRYEAEVQAADAELARAKAGKVEADRRLKRGKTLVKRGNIAIAKVDEAEADARSAAADVLKRQAELRRAQIDLGYTKVMAPISGRVGRNRIDMGNLVGEGEATVLTDVTKYDPMYVYFNLNELDLLRVIEVFREKVKEKGIDPKKDSSAKARIPIQVGLANEEGYPHEGIIDFSESGLDAGTGTVQIRARFENSERPPRMFPGLFTRVRMAFAERANMPLVTERAIGDDQSGPFVLEINAKNIVEKRLIKVGQRIDGLRVIEEGVRAGDRIVVKGLQRARPGAEVDPTSVDMSSLTVSAIRNAAQKAEREKASKAPVSSDKEKQP
jgi:RND family efflux transporter MFP subunit